MSSIEHPELNSTEGTSHWATGTAIAAVVALAASGLIAAYAMWNGGQAGLTRTWEGAAAAMTFFVALGLSLCGFAAGLNAKLSNDKHVGVWLAMALFPVLAVFLVVVEMGVIL